jgi:acyl phosphate:glycerol-3-phosphate acyltransferase
VIALIIKMILSYLIGSLLGSLVVGRLTGRGDIRRSGSGNPGSTNALRTHGKLFALGVAIIDVSKGWVATRLVPALALPLAPPPSGVHDWLPAACGAGVMLGHVFPLWFGFRGGKAVATFFGATVGLVPWLGLAALLIWGGVLVITGFVGLASMIAAASLPILLACDRLAWYRPYLAFAMFAALLVLATHRTNIARMRAGREPRAQRLWLLGRRATS